MKLQLSPETQDTLVVIVDNLERLSEAAALLIMASFAVFAAYHYRMAPWFKTVLLVAAMVIAVRGAIEFLKHLAQRPVRK